MFQKRCFRELAGSDVDFKCLIYRLCECLLTLKDIFILLVYIYLMLKRGVYVIKKGVHLSKPFINRRFIIRKKY